MGSRLARLQSNGLGRSTAPFESHDGFFLALLTARGFGTPVTRTRRAEEQLVSGDKSQTAYCRHVVAGSVSELHPHHTTSSRLPRGVPRV